MSNNMRKIVNFPVGIRKTAVAQVVSDVVNLGEVQALVAGLNLHKEAVAVDADVNVDLATGGLLTLDAYTLLDGDRVLAHSQTDASENGVYVASSGAWSRATDSDEASELQAKTSVTVLNGTHAGRKYELQESNPVVGTDDQTWTVTSASSNAAIDTAVDQTSFSVITGANSQAVFEDVDTQLSDMAYQYNAVIGTTGDDLGTGFGSIIQDNSSVLDALGYLEVAIESNATIYDDNRYESASTTLTQGSAITFNHAIGTKRLSGIKVYDTADEDITHTVVITLVDANSITVQNDDVDIDVFVVCAK